MEVLLTKPVVVVLALVGAALSTAASFLQRRGRLGERQAHRLNLTGYGFMGASMLLFALAGLRGVPG